MSSRNGAAVLEIEAEDDEIAIDPGSLGMREVTFNLSGISPLICHNGQLADPRNDYVIAMKKITSIKANKRTPDQDQALCDLEWEGGLYLNEKMQPIIPGDVLEALLVEGAKSFSKGREFKSGTMVEGDSVIQHDGPKKLPALKADKNFRDYRGVKVGMSRVFRTRPIFVKWALTVTVSYNPEVVGVELVRRAIEVAGKLKGLCDNRPKYGRFIATEVA